MERPDDLDARLHELVDELRIGEEAGHVGELVDARLERQACATLSAHMRRHTQTTLVRLLDDRVELDA